MTVYDLIVIGAGPAGITAAVYAARKKMNFLVVTGDVGGQTAWSGDIENYTGYQFITGPDLAAKFEEHMRTYGMTVKEGEEASLVEKRGSLIRVRTDKAEYESKTVIIASGKRSKELDVPGEKEFKNKGLTYCATCDGPLFTGKNVAIIGGGNSALDAALQLVKIAKKVYIINNTLGLGGDLVMREKVESHPAVKVLNKTVVLEIIGRGMVSGIRVRVDDREELINVEGVFVEIGLVPNSKFTRGIDQNEFSEIKVNSGNETNIPGVFAAGDVTDVPEKQIIIASGEGAKAALGAFKYLSRTR